MATRSYIGIERENKKVEYVYCHWDGDPHWNGVILDKIYNNTKKINELLSHGDMSSLGETIEKTTFHINDSDYEWEDCKPETVDIDVYLSDGHDDMSKCIGDEFRYLFTRENKWIVYDTTLKKEFDLKEYISFTEEEIDELYEEV